MMKSSIVPFRLPRRISLRSNQLNHAYDLRSAPQQEMAFLALVNYSTTVRRGQYARYYYALEDVSRIEWSNGGGSVGL